MDYDKKYHHRVSASRGGQSSGWSEELETKVPLPNLGHQADHTVKYQIGVMPTPVPGADPSEDPGVVIPAAITHAVAAWNKAVATPSPHVLFCEGAGCTVNGVDRNTDGTTFVVTTERGKVDITLAYVEQYRDADEHLRGPATLVIEQPPVDRSSPWNAPVTRVWTNNLDQHNKNKGERKYHYLPTVVMHEFGHTAGLGDLYLLESWLCNKGGDSPWDDLTCAYNNYIMGGDVTETAIPNEDRDYLWDVYRNHTSHALGSD